MAVIAVGYFLAEKNISSGDPGATVSTDSPPGPQASSQSVAPAVVLPSEEQTLITIVNQFTSNYNGAANQMAQGAFRPARAQAICGLLQGQTQVTDWVGTISTMTSNNEGKGVLAVDISPGITVSTWNNDPSDVADNTLIAPGSSLLSNASAMTIGSAVKFSGNFFSGGTDCIEEQSLTMDGSMTSPVFVFKFSDVEPYTSQ